MRQQIYLPDDLAEQLKGYNLNVSAICQVALKEAMRTRSPHDDTPIPAAKRLGALVENLAHAHDHALDHAGHILVHQREGLGELYERLIELRP